MPFHADESTGLLSHYIGTVETSFAGTDAAYQDGTVTRMSWDTTVDDVLQEDYDGIVPETLTQNITLGDGWDTDLDGRLFHEDDELRASKNLKPKEFKLTSVYGNLIGLVAGQVDDWYNGNYEVNDGGEPFNCDLTGVMTYFDKNKIDDPNDPKAWQGFT